MVITAVDVKKLRDATGTGMLDAKKALIEAKGNYEKAIEPLRISGLAKAVKRTDCEVTNGTVAGRDEILIQFAAEIDFVAKNVEFVGLGNRVVDAVAVSGAKDLGAAKTAPLGSTTVRETVQSLVATIGKNLPLVNVVNYDGDTHLYLHRHASDLSPQVGVLVEYTGGDETLVHQVAMHIVAMSPAYASRDEALAEAVENERRIVEVTAREEGKPEGAVPRIIEGRLGGFYKDVALLDQPAVWEDKKTVGNVLEAAGVEIKRFARLAVGARSWSGETSVSPWGRVRPVWDDIVCRDASPTRKADPTNKPYQRVLLKLPREVSGGGELGVDPAVISGIAKKIAAVVSRGTQVAVVVGGGDYFRGAELSNNSMARDRADYMGMLGTVMNVIALQDLLEKEGIRTRVQSAIDMVQVAEPYTPRRAERHLEKGRLATFGAGSGMPYSSIDTVAAQRALEIGAEVLLMGKQGAGGAYDSDPRTNPEARRYERLTYDEFLFRDLKAADTTAIALAHDNTPNTIFFNLSERGNIGRVVQGEPVGAFISR